MVMSYKLFDIIFILLALALAAIGVGIGRRRRRHTATDNLTLAATHWHWHSECDSVDHSECDSDPVSITASNLPKLVISTNANNSTVRTYTAIVMMVDVSGRPAGAYP